MHSPNRSLLDTDRIGPLLFKLALPSFLGMFVVTLYNVVNTIFVGHYVGPLGIAGLSLVFPFQMFAMGLGQVSGMGGASLISRLIGSRDIQKAEKTLGNAFLFNLIVSVVVTAAGLLFPDFWLKLAGASDTVLPYARDYMQIIFIGMVANIFVMSCNGLVISEGNTRVVMVAQITGAVLNVILDSVLIIWLGWGVKGAAIGTVIAQIVSAIIFLGYYLSGRSYVKIRLRNLRIELQIMRGILAIGVSALASTLTSSISAVLVMRMLEIYGGDIALSTFGIINRIMMFSMMPAMVTGQGFQPIAGFNYGAKRYDRVLQGLKIALIVSTCWGLIAFIVLNLFAGNFLRVFTDDAQLISLGTYAIHRAFFFIYLIGFLMVGMTTFVALGKATQSFITSITRSALFLIPALFILANLFQLDGVWMAFPVVDALTTVLIAILLIPQIHILRKKRKLQNTTVPVELET